MIPTISLPPILQADDLAQSCKVVEAIVSNVCNAVLLIEKQYAGEGGAQYGMYQRALSEVHSDYRNPMLNVALLADRLGISTVLLSRIFKKFHGFNISDYISSVRVEAAKALLREGVLVSEVVEQCGFGSLRTFMRVFKNSEKLTPGQYRSLQGEE
jgi:AraC-like DNA-binding protein